MPCHNQANSKRRVAATRQVRTTSKVDKVVDVQGKRLVVSGGLALPPHWSRVPARQLLDEMDYNHVRSTDELADFVARY